MSEKKAVKVVKRVERQSRSKKKVAPKTAHDLVTTVTSWVSEFQRKRRDETSEAIQTLVQARRQPAES